jgi:hypothetical protein
MGLRRPSLGRSRQGPRLAGLTRTQSAASPTRPNGDTQSQIAASAFGATVLVAFAPIHQYPSQINWSCEKCGLGPDVDPFMLHIHAAVAEKERSRIAQRTKDALAAAKARGQQLGNPDIGKLRKAEAEERATHLRAIIEPLRSLPAKRISTVLNDRKITTPRGGKWQATQVIRLLNRLNLVPA